MYAVPLCLQGHQAGFALRTHRNKVYHQSWMRGVPQVRRSLQVLQLTDKKTHIRLGESHAARYVSIATLALWFSNYIELDFSFCF